MATEHETFPETFKNLLPCRDRYLGRRLHLYLGIAVLLSTTACGVSQRPRPRHLPPPPLQAQDTSLEFSQEEYATFREELLKTSIAPHFSILFGAGVESTQSLPTDEQLNALDDALDEARRAIVRAHEQHRSNLETWTHTRLKNNFPSSINVAQSMESFADVKAAGRIHLSVGLLRAQAHGAVANTVGDKPDDRSAYAEFTDAIMVMLRVDQFRDFHSLHDLKWRNNSSGAGATVLVTMLIDAGYRAGLWFVIAHEMGHLAMGDTDRELNCVERQASELAADSYATAILSFTLKKEEMAAASALLGSSSDRDTNGAAGYDYFFLIGYPEAFPSSSNDGCQVHAPASQRAELIRPIAARTFQPRIAPKVLDSLKATHEEWAPGVTSAVSAKCSINESDATQKIKGTVDALLGLYTGALIQIGIEPQKEIVRGIHGLIERGETPDCEGPFLFEFKFRKS
jgi:hypothetical protein